MIKLVIYLVDQRKYEIKVDQDNYNSLMKWYRGDAPFGIFDIQYDHLFVHINKQCITSIEEVV